MRKNRENSTIQNIIIIRYRKKKNSYEFAYDNLREFIVAIKMYRKINFLVIIINGRTGVAGVGGRAKTVTTTAALSSDVLTYLYFASTSTGDYRERTFR